MSVVQMSPRSGCRGRPNSSNAISSKCLPVNRTPVKVIHASAGRIKCFVCPALMMIPAPNGQYPLAEHYELSLGKTNLINVLLELV